MAIVSRSIAFYAKIDAVTLRRPGDEAILNIGTCIWSSSVCCDFALNHRKLHLITTIYHTVVTDLVLWVYSQC